ncbi:MAG: phenylalanine--tRNA ligase subunit alpha [Candidatus Bathyarchaeota archaeon]|nr:phenylalanine--tRNA ligase subunit alpha [Candidatus Bathyarchaeota archaeon]
MVEIRETEKRILTTLVDHDGIADVDQICNSNSLAHAAVVRAAVKLAKEKLLRVQKITQTIVTLNKEGKIYAKGSLPERRLVTSLIKLGGKARFIDAAATAKLEANLVPIALGWLLRKGWAKFDDKKKTLSREHLEEPGTGCDEEVLKLIGEKEKVTAEKLDNEEREAIEILRKRKLLELKEETRRILELSQKGRRMIERGLKIDEGISQLTPELIVTGKWRKIKLRSFDVKAPGSLRYPGKIHPLQQIIQRAREIFLEMGFTEIRGPLVETAFWNFDALFQPQDHPAREMADTFYLSIPKAGKLPSKNTVEAVAKTHENGWITGSTGWQYKWRAEEARRLVLRTHTTSETIKHLSKHKKPPIKVFSVDRVYRNEELTYLHTAEFFQIEGIVADNGVNLRDLMGTLKSFYNRFGLREVQFWPCYFPYTEPSAQAMVYVPKLKRWIELCGMGMFRPEVLAPMGIKYPVLAWGGGLERIAMIELGLNDIRQLYGNNLGWIRRTPICL